MPREGGAKLEYQYYEVCIGNGPEESGNDFWMCIRGVREPSIQEAEQFLAGDIAKNGGRVLGVYPIDQEAAKGSYDFSYEEQWPVFGLPKTADCSGGIANE